MDKSLEAKRFFDASNKRMLQALRALENAGEENLLEQIHLEMPVSVYEYMIDHGYYSTIKRDKSDRRSIDRRVGERRHSGKR